METNQDMEHLGEHERMLLKPGVYIGSVDANETKRYIYDFKVSKMEKKIIWVPEGLERLYLEGTSNAGDHTVRSRQSKHRPGIILIGVDSKTVTIYNTGMPFIIKKFGGNTEFKDYYVQELGFGVIGTSSNYNDKNRSYKIGTNGVGIKLVNIYSNHFTLVVVDGKNKLYYIQKWSDNMYKRDKPEVRKMKKGEKTHTKVTYTLDFSRFDKIFKDGYTEEVLGLFAFHCSYMAMLNGIPITFTRKNFEPIVFNPLNAIEYIKFLRGIDLGKVKYIHHVEWIQKKGDKEVNVVRTKVNGIVNVPKSVAGMTKIDVLIYDTPDAGECMSFVNGLITYDGGVHENVIMNKIRDVVITKINDDIKENGRKYKLNMRDLRPHVSIMVSCRLDNAELRGQMKTYLNKPTPEFNIDENKLGKMLQWDLAERLQNTIQAKQIKILSRTDGVKKGRIDLSKLVDAGKAGGKESHLCSLDIVEGQSAQNYSNQRSVAINGGKSRSPYIGSLPFRGKPMNVLNALRKKDGLIILNENEEYKALKKAMGFKEGVDYRINRNYRSLRYGKIIILADSDVDGKHIAGLIYLMLWTRFLTFLLRGGTVFLLRTPIVRTEKGKQKLDFLTQEDFDSWTVTINTKGWDIKYCKGLASSSPDEIKRDAKNPKLVEITFDEMAEYYLRLAFDNDRKARKKWMESYDSKNSEDIEKLSKLTIARFIDHEMISHCIVNTLRTLPGLDGLKEGQRKALYTAFGKWGKEKYLKTDSLVVITQMNTHYRYGPAALLGAIDLMPLTYTGSNNLPYFGQGGTAGSRRKNGKDAGASRYTSLIKMSWWGAAYKKADIDLWEYVWEDGKRCEPTNLLPVVATLLFNGQKGIGTGWSTFIPNYNPLDVCKWLKSKIKELVTPKMTPWYRGFEGTIRVVLTIVKRTTDENGKVKVTKLKKNALEPGIEEFYPQETGKTMITKGMYHIETRQDKKGKQEEVVVVTEIPIGSSIDGYDTFLKGLIEEGEITDFDEQCGNNNIRFEVYGMKNPSINKLSLESRYGMTNMTIIDENRKPRQFKRIDDLLEYWFNIRKQFYPKRISNALKKKKEQTKGLSDKYKFVEAIIKGNKMGKKLGETLVIVNEDKESISTQLKALELGYDLLSKVKTVSLTNTEEGLRKLKREMQKVKEEIEYYQNINPMDVWYKEIEEFEVAYKKLEIKQD